MSCTWCVSHSLYRTSEAKLNNFMRLDPTFRQLEVPFNINQVLHTHDSVVYGCESLVLCHRLVM